jgi:hypothetical protein
MANDADYTPQAGDIGLTQISGRTGQAIRVGMWLNGESFVNYQHAFVYTGDTNIAARGMIVEAEPGPAGARYVELHYAPENVRWCRGLSYGLTDEKRVELAQAACGVIGVGYSFLDYVALASHRLGIPGPGLKAYISDTGHEICSQLCDLVYQKAGIQLFDDDRWPGYVTPLSLYRRDLVLRGVHSIGV